MIKGTIFTPLSDSPRHATWAGGMSYFDEGRNAHEYGSELYSESRIPAR